MLFLNISFYELRNFMPSTLLDASGLILVPAYRLRVLFPKIGNAADTSQNNYFYWTCGYSTTYSKQKHNRF